VIGKIDQDGKFVAILGQVRVLSLKSGFFIRWPRFHLNQTKKAA
jgi:hypothetical protein